MLGIQRLTGSFHHKDYRRFWTATMLTQMTLRMQDVVLGWQMLEASNSAFWVGLVTFARHVPLLIWSPITGVWADRMKRQWITAAALIVISSSSAGLALVIALGRLSPWHIIVTAFVLGSAFAVYAPARSALLPNLVPASMLLSASTIQFSSGRLMGFFGPVAAGALVDATGTPPTLMVEVVLCALAALVFFRTAEHVGRPLQRPDERGSILRGFRDVVAYLRNDQPLLALMLLDLVIVPIGISYHSLMPVFAQDILGAGASTLGLMLGVYYMGIALAGFVMAAVGDTFRKGRVVLLSAIGFSCGLVALAVSRQVAFALALLFLLGLLAGVFLTLNMVLFQSRPPDRLRGRAMSAGGMVWGLGPFVSLVTGTIAEHWGVTTAITASGVVCGSFSVGLALVGSHLREL
jgi:MFS family permease